MLTFPGTPDTFESAIQTANGQLSGELGGAPREKAEISIALETALYWYREAKRIQTIINGGGTP